MEASVGACLGAWDLRGRIGPALWKVCAGAER